MSLHVLASAAERTYRFHIDEHTRALQATLRFKAYGNFPMRALHFRFYQPDGVLVYEIRPVQGWSPRHGLLGHIRTLSLAQRLEHLLRKALGQNAFFSLDLPPDCLSCHELSVSVQNVASAPAVVGMFQLRTSPLAPGRIEQNRHSIEGYSDRISVFPGEPLELFVHAPLRRFALTVIRHGAHEQSILHIAGIEGKPQHYAANAYERGANWERSFTLETGPDWRGGMYVARISDTSGATFDITFIVKQTRLGGSAGLAVLASTNTWLAYNDWGGASLYRYHIDDGLGKGEAANVHMRRPNPAATTAGNDGHLANAEKHVLRWLEQNEVDYDLYADIDLHEAPGLLGRYHTLLINTHSEYWTDAMHTGLENFMEAGGNLVYLSGNGLYWKVEINGQQLEVRRDNASHSLSGESGGLWRDCGRPEAKLLGVRYSAWAGVQSTYKPYKVISPQHWIFEGTGVRKGSLIGKSGVNRGGASGWEVDTIDRHNKPAGLVHLAKGTNPRRNGADMTYFEHTGGGAVFSAGSITFGGSLLVDPVLGQMLRNVLARFARNAKGGQDGAGHAAGQAPRNPDRTRQELPQ